METGKRSLDKIGFSSPKPGTNKVTMHQIAKTHNIQLPRKRQDAEPILLRTLAIVRIKQLDRYASEKYENKKEASKWHSNQDHGDHDYLIPFHGHVQFA